MPTPQSQYRFAAELVGFGPGIKTRLAEAGLRDWRFDFAWPEARLAVECEGGAFANGRHTRGTGFAADLRKYHAAQLAGWTVYRCDMALIKSGEAAEAVKSLLDRAGVRTLKNQQRAA